MSPHIPRADDAHTSDGGSDPNASFMEKYSPWSYVILGGVCAAVLLFCLYALWRGPQRAFLPLDALSCRRKKNKKALTASPEREQGVGQSAGQKKVYLTDVRRAAHTLHKKPPPGILNDWKNQQTPNPMSTERQKGEIGRRAGGNASWAGTISSFGHPASMMDTGTRPPLQRQVNGTQTSILSGSDRLEMFHTPQSRMDGQSWALSGPHDSVSSTSSLPSSRSVFRQQTYTPPINNKPTIGRSHHSYSGSTPNLTTASPNTSQDIYAPSPVHVRSRSTGTSPMVPSPLGTPPLPTARHSMAAIPSPRLGPRVQFSSLLLPKRDVPTGSPLATTPPTLPSAHSPSHDRGQELGVAI
ncbi:hypothetical protein L198_05323 [Cryptococcus wingfieldii CBS 7118]|uniref:Uncharacterized protein n=1 Tax=Cryptococcus wingfieldii CBS 7118 TaxID=1295528 RepID=A0A1E3IY37_9TREE|nr:hypothetical protein L198_05323 [Cryptococcus wingfieldii CBS 7118]ODN93458.1 hypothetical protein L198_05323 [Cryptococcus wingfieldii CBS 7118]